MEAALLTDKNAEFYGQKVSSPSGAIDLQSSNKRASLLSFDELSASNF